MVQMARMVVSTSTAEPRAESATPPSSHSLRSRFPAGRYCGVSLRSSVRQAAAKSPAPLLDSRLGHALHCHDRRSARVISLAAPSDRSSGRERRAYLRAGGPGAWPRRGLAKGLRPCRSGTVGPPAFPRTNSAARRARGRRRHRASGTPIVSRICAIPVRPIRDRNVAEPALPRGMDRVRARADRLSSRSAKKHPCANSSGPARPQGR